MGGGGDRRRVVASGGTNGFSFGWGDVRERFALPVGHLGVGHRAESKTGATGPVGAGAETETAGGREGRSGREEGATIHIRRSNV
jgi:hypothetical protein